MPQRCACCTHPKRADINERLLKGGEPDSAISADYGMARESVRRHRTRHLSFSAQAATESRNVATIVGYASDLYERAVKVLDRAEEVLTSDESSSRSVQAAAASLREVRSAIELLAKLIVNEPAGDDRGTRSAELDTRISQALDLITLPALGPGDTAIADAELVE